MWSEAATRSETPSPPAPGADKKERNMQGFLKIEGLTKTYTPGKPVFANVNFPSTRGSSSASSVTRAAAKPQC